MAGQEMAVNNTTYKFDIERFSDLVIKFSGQERKVHRIVMYLASEWFRTALTGSFIEADATSIELHNDDPDALDHMISLCYFDATTERQDYMETMLLHVKNKLAASLNILIVADKYGCRGVLEFAQKYTEHYLSSYTPQRVGSDDFFRAVDVCFSLSIPAFDPMRKTMLELIQSNIAKWYRKVNETGYKGLMAQVAKHSAIGAALVADFNPWVLRPRTGHYRCGSCARYFVIFAGSQHAGEKHHCPNCKKAL